MMYVLTVKMSPVALGPGLSVVPARQKALRVFDVNLEGSAPNVL